MRKEFLEYTSKLSDRAQTFLLKELSQVQIILRKLSFHEFLFLSSVNLGFYTHAWNKRSVGPVVKRHVTVGIYTPHVLPQQINTVSMNNPMLSILVWNCGFSIYNDAQMFPHDEEIIYFCMKSARSTRGFSFDSIHNNFTEH